ncbi:hypothetical protein RHMOL_Rhmol02G0175800 [Rhododendron molle]|uniref:Uncharacterized protein n=1 Tax=Rhododendron molle TaxID=49168 RepID=A0ACC0PSP3_RHOML|nr:hypothetical protein RHMOL_Rhmol02G0175800 [Rhododendron molle]
MKRLTRTCKKKKKKKKNDSHSVFVSTKPMDSKPTPAVRFTVGKQSSLAPERSGDENDIESVSGKEEEDERKIDGRVRLMNLANEGDLEGIKELLESGTDVNFRDIDDRTALHVAACQVMVMSWSSSFRMAPRLTPKTAGEARWHQCMSKMPVKSQSMKLTHRSWTLQIVLRLLRRAFSYELALLQKIRHPNVVQFLGALTQSTPMMIVTEYLPKGDLRAFLKRKGALRTTTAVRFALDIARLSPHSTDSNHSTVSTIQSPPLQPIDENLKSTLIEVIQQCYSDNRSILRDDSGHLKVADFGVSKLLKVTSGVKEDKPLICQDSSSPYVAPEVFRNDEYDTKVDIFSFALILQEMIEGCPPFFAKKENEVPKSYVEKECPPFRAPCQRAKQDMFDLMSNQRQVDRAPEFLFEDRNIGILSPVGILANPM